ncbi:signal peptidase I [Bacillus sp. RG28]|uniref:Signal peptidase I n=1 Tax=Gottfriedia endophytica TaxID=2820819 RepID=A0A940NJ76_9BACI|nr:signal peptidase I [Gottfriedia endophytica]MBP0725112.1 signal peptidase I [Gottfriedia endophytica]
MIKKIISNTITFVLVIFLATMLFFTISAKINGGQPKIFGNELLTVLSGSMEPTFMTGSVIAVKPVTDPKTLKVGDVVTYKTINDPNMKITHRIKEIKTENGQLSFITKGDNNDSQDPKPIPQANIVDKYSNFTIPYLGYIIAFSKTKMGIISLMIVPGIAIFLWQMISLFLSIIKLDKKEESVKA